MKAYAITVAVNDVTSAQSRHEQLAATLGFPDYCGKNWDAFWDCITVRDHSEQDLAESEEIGAPGGPHSVVLPFTQYFGGARDTFTQKQLRTFG